MKTKYDPRHRHRIQTVRELFAYSFSKKNKLGRQAKDVLKNIERIDKHITNSAPQWPIDKISKIDLAILRNGVYELLIVQKEPSKVIIDESVELAKEFGSDTSPRFVNGVLGTILTLKVY